MTSNYVRITFFWGTAIISNIYCFKPKRPLKGLCFLYSSSSSSSRNVGATGEDYCDNVDLTVVFAIR
jgi:hypothetical protein